MKLREADDLAIMNGLVIDPASNTQVVANVGVIGKQIVAITKEKIHGRVEINAENLVVTPGFIDILSSVLPVREAHLNKITDGVTTCIGMHGGPIDVAGYRRNMESIGPLVNYARAVGHADLRRASGANDRYVPASTDQIDKMRHLAGQAIRDGAVGIGFGINYTPGASHEEILALFQTASDFSVPCHVHSRFKGNIPPHTMSLAVEEVIALAAATGARAQLVHLTSSTVGSAAMCIALIEGAAKHGVDVGFDFHLWTRNETNLQSALYDEGWQERFGGITYEDLYVASTQERLTKERFEQLRETGKDTLVQSEFIREEEIEAALRSPLGIIASDGRGLVEGRGHPRSSATFSRLLGRYVREKKMISLMDAVRKITFMPAVGMESAIPAMARKGRLQVGADADITIFDSRVVRDNATYEEPSLPSEGIEYVIVNGAVVLDKGKMVQDVVRGEWLGHLPEPVTAKGSYRD